MPADGARDIFLHQVETIFRTTTEENPMDVQLIRTVICSMALLTINQSALAWSKPGHMVNAAIAYEELQAKHPRLAQRIAELMAQHPDRGSFEVAINGAKDEERLRRLFAEMARWPDDVRGGAYDHPTWHYASKPIVDPSHPTATAPADAFAGSAVEAFALNAKVAGDVRAPAAERAVALCWIFHLVGDIHQPLHAADWHSSRYPEGDLGGNRQYVLDPQSRQPTSLHGYWDGIISRSGEVGPAFERGRELRTRYPRSGFTEIAARSNVSDFVAWAVESNALARSQAYGRNLSTSPTPEKAPALSAVYIADSTAIAERRVTLAGYRLADLLAVLVRE
jgi:hypothetical protein